MKVLRLLSKLHMLILRRTLSVLRTFCNSTRILFYCFKNSKLLVHLILSLFHWSSNEHFTVVGRTLPGCYAIAHSTPSSTVCSKGPKVFFNDLIFLVQSFFRSMYDTVSIICEPQVTMKHFGSQKCARVKAHSKYSIWAQVPTTKKF